MGDLYQSETDSVGAVVSLYPRMTALVVYSKTDKMQPLLTSGRLWQRLRGYARPVPQRPSEPRRRIGAPLSRLARGSFIQALTDKDSLERMHAARTASEVPA